MDGPGGGASVNDKTRAKDPSFVILGVSGNKKNRSQRLRFNKRFGGVLLSHTASHAVPSAQKSLTSVFEMGTGVASSLSPPKTVITSLTIF